MDQKVLKLLAYLYEYTMELYQTYTEYKANISELCDDVWMSQDARINMMSSFDDIMQQWPGQKNDENFPSQAMNNEFLNSLFTEIESRFGDNQKNNAWNLTFQNKNKPYGGFTEGIN